MLVDKDTYNAWQSEVITRFYTPARSHTELIPVDGERALLSKEKVILTVVPNGATEAVKNGNEVDVHPKKDKIKLWNIKEGELGFVSFGYEGSVMKYPACDGFVALGGHCYMKR